MSDNSVKVYASAAAAALVAASGSSDVAFASDTNSAVAKGNPLTVTVVGGLVLSDFSKDNLFDDYGSHKLGLETHRDVGGFGSIAVGRAFEAGSPFDWRISGSVTEFLKNDRAASLGVYGYGYGAGLHDSAGWQHFDMEVGRNLESSNAHLRVGLGARLTHFKNASSFDGSVSYFGYGYALNVGEENEFFGGGPRASVEGRIGGTFGLEFAASVAALFGKEASKPGYDLSAEYFGLSFPVVEIGAAQADWRWLSDVELSAGVSVKPSDSVSISAGYRYERIGDVGSNLTPDNVTSAGPYVKASVKF